MSRSCWLVLAALVCMVGCNQEGGSVDTVPVTGVVTLDGAPVPGASVSFSPTDSSGRAAVGQTDIDGKFSLTTLNPGDGAIPGSYAVTVTKSAGPAAKPFEDPRASGGKMTPEQTQQMMESLQKGKEATAAPQSALPEKYASQDTSGLTATVSDSGPNNFTFELKSN